jgi:hypothetical protein
MAAREALWLARADADRRAARAAESMRLGNRFWPWIFGGVGTGLGALAGRFAGGGARRILGGAILGGPAAGGATVGLRSLRPSPTQADYWTEAGLPAAATDYLQQRLPPR